MVEERASKRQQELLSFVDGFIKENGYGPSYREIMRALGYKSVSTVAIHIDNLIAKGYLARRDKSARSLEVVSLSPVAQAPVQSAHVSIEPELIRLIASKHLTEDERKQAAALFERLELAAVVAALTTKDSDASS